MAKFECPLVTVNNIKKHPNADSLSLVKIEGYTVVVRTGDFTEGQRAIYIPEDSLVPIREEFAFLWGDKEPIESRRVVRAKKLRGMFSCGFIIPCPTEFINFPVGTDVSKKLGIEKHEKSEQVSTGGDNTLCPTWFIEYTNIENIRRHPNILEIGEEVVLTEKIHGCLKRDTKIRMADGSTRKIQKIRKGDLVLGYDGKSIIPTKVTNIFNNGHGEEWLNIKTTRRAAGKGNSFSSVYCTPNHKFWIGNKYKQAKNLRTNENVYVSRTDIDITPMQKSVILGKLLGDGHLHITKNNIAALVFTHKKEHVKYLNWSIEALGDIAEQKDKQISGYGTTMFRASTKFSCFIYDKFSSFYMQSKKIVPEWVATEIDPISIAFWYMDDGSLGHHTDQEDRANFACCNFSKKDCNVLLEGLKRFNISGKYFQDTKGYSRIRLNADEAEKLFLLIAPYVPPIMQYKLPERYREHKGWIPQTNKIYKSKLIEQKILSITDVTDKIRSNKYDIETETHNFFCPDILVHNSNARFCFKDNKLWIGSHHNCKRERVPLSKMGRFVLKALVKMKLLDPQIISVAERMGNIKKDMWTYIAKKLDLETKLKHYPGLIFFGELYGKVQKGYDYGCGDGYNFRVFDIYSTHTKSYLSYARVLEICEFANLNTVPEIYRGRWEGLDKMEHWAEGKTFVNVLDKERHIREGVVVKPVVERWTDRAGRVIFKMISKEYLLRKK